MGRTLDELTPVQVGILQVLWKQIHLRGEDSPLRVPEITRRMGFAYRDRIDSALHGLTDGSRGWDPLLTVMIPGDWGIHTKGRRPRAYELGQITEFPSTGFFLLELEAFVLKESNRKRAIEEEFREHLVSRGGFCGNPSHPADECVLEADRPGKCALGSFDNTVEYTTGRGYIFRTAPDVDGRRYLSPDTRFKRERRYLEWLARVYLEGTTGDCFTEEERLCAYPAGDVYREWKKRNPRAMRSLTEQQLRPAARGTGA